MLLSAPRAQEALAGHCNRMVLAINEASNSGLVVGVGKSPLDLYHMTITFNCATVSNCSWLLVISLIARTLVRSARYSRSFSPLARRLCLPAHAHAPQYCPRHRDPHELNGCGMWSTSAVHLTPGRLDESTSLAVAIRFCLISSQFTQFLASLQITTSTMEAISDPANPQVRFIWFST